MIGSTTTAAISSELGILLTPYARDTPDWEMKSSISPSEHRRGTLVGGTRGVTVVGIAE
jgi:hypothetical protein